MTSACIVYNGLSARREGPVGSGECCSDDFHLLSSLVSIQNQLPANQTPHRSCPECTVAQGREQAAAPPCPQCPAQSQHQFCSQGSWAPASHSLRGNTSLPHKPCVLLAVADQLGGFMLEREKRDLGTLGGDPTVRWATLPSPYCCSHHPPKGRATSSSGWETLVYLQQHHSAWPASHGCSLSCPGRAQSCLLCEGDLQVMLDEHYCTLPCYAGPERNCLSVKSFSINVHQRAVSSV